MDYQTLVVIAERTFETAGILAMLGGSIAALSGYARNREYHVLRRRLAHAILLGLELLVAADIIATVSTVPELDSVLALAVIVLIRTFLSFSLEMEATGRWPWDRAQGTTRRDDDV